MMVETILESSQDFGMSNGALPQWKRELLQRRAARSRPAAPPAPPPPPPPPPPPADEDGEELRYGPGIVKRLKSRYLSLALRDAPRRRPSVLRRATSLEHLLDERPPPAPRAPGPRAARPASVAAAPAPLAPVARRDSVKRARSVDALSRLDSREELGPPPLAPRPPAPRAARPPRRPAPLLRDTERPPPDVVRSTLRKFESGPPRRAAPAARVSAVLRGLEAPRRSLTPEREPEARSPSPPDAPDAPAPVPTPPPPSSPAPPPPVESPPPPPIESPPPPSTPPPPAPAPSPPAISADGSEPECAPRAVSRAALEGIARAGCTVRYAFEAPRAGSHLPPLAATNPVLVGRRVGVIRPMPASPRARPASPPPPEKPEEPAPAHLVNGHSTPEPRVVSRIGAAGIERAWSGSPGRRPPPEPAAPLAPWLRAAPRSRAPPAPATSVVFNFSNRKEVPDYIENDGIILRASRRTRLKGVDGGGGGDEASSDSEAESRGPPSPCAVRFVNDNVLINGRSSMPAAHDRDRLAKLKLQFDDSLTRTFEYPSETSLCEEEPLTPPAPSPADAPSALLADNTHMASAALSRYTPHKTPPPAFQLGVARHAPASAPAPAPAAPHDEAGEAACEGAGAHAVPCGAGARAWSDARARATDLLF